MKATLSWRRRLILGMSIEDARSKFDTPESRVALRLAHERHNQGLYHELTLAQRQRNRLPAERKCHLVRHTKPSVKGFQAYIKSCPDDYVVREIWRGTDKATERIESGGVAEGDGNSKALGDAEESTASEAETGGRLSRQPPEGSEKAEKTQCTSTGEAAAPGVTTSEKSDSGVVGRADIAPSPPSHIGRQIILENGTYTQHRAVVLAELARVADTLGSDVRQQLTERRENGTLLPTRHNSVVDRLVDDVKEAKEKGYTSLSSSSHLLEPLNLTMNLCNKKDKLILEAFRSPLLCLRAEEHHISLSLWVAGSIIEKEELGTEFPYHIAKHTEPLVGEDGTVLPMSRLPKAHIEVYFSPELYQLQQTLGVDGVLALRRFIGRVMKRQHDPLPTVSSIVLNMRPGQQESCGLSTGEATQIPWLHLIKAKVASSTGTVLEVTSEDAPAIPAMREAIQLVWCAWGHLVKDLHVHGDLDYLYVSVRPQLEIGNANKRDVLPSQEGTDSAREMVLDHQQEDTQSASSIRSMGDAVEGLVEGDNSVWKGFKRRKSHAKTVLIPADFVVVECTLEKKGLPHRLVVEDVVESLTELQRQAMEMQRLAIVDNGGSNPATSDYNEDDEGEEGSSVVRPVLYAPKITVSHAGVIDAAAHGFQRIRIRGSCLAHVEALARALQTGEHFTDREGLSLLENGSSSDGGVTALLLPSNLSFSATRSDVQAHTAARQLLGHRVPSSYTVQRTANGRFRVHQTLRPLQGMVADKEEREFWGAHYYRLSDIRLLFHDRVSAVDLENTSTWSPTLKEQLLAISQKRNSKHRQEDEAAEMAIVEGVTSVDDTDDTGARGKKPRKKKLKSKRAATTLSLEEIVASMSTEKIFEYLCVDMEVESASYDLRVGDNDGYAYRVKLRRIPESHLPLVKPAMRSLEEKGFINYFGPQRFASYTKHNMHPGLHLLKGEYRAAASIIVQQFALDAEIAAERRRTGAAFAKMYHSKAMGFHLPDRSISHRNRRSIAAHGTALQSILDNALRAASMLGEDEEDGVAGVAEVDPCEEAFLRVVGPKACSMLVHEFLAFVWNDIVNQRLQRYGTFAILPGDLVRQNPLASPHSAEYGRVKYATKKGIDRSDYNFWDVVLPLPGVGVQLPENHTTDLYIVTLKRMGILFNPETRQWDIFRPRRSFSGEDAAAHSTMAASPYRRFSSSFALMEEELGSSTTMVETIDGRDNDVAEEVGSLADVGHLRSDLRRGVTPGNPLGVNIYGFYRHLLINPVPTLTWRVRVGHSGDPHQRWALGVRRAFTRNSSSSSSSISNSVHGTPVGTNSSNGQQQQQPSLLLGRSTLTKGERRQRTAPPVPYWLPQKSDVSVDLSFELPSSVYPSMLLREITKSDVNSPETVDLDRPLLDTRAKSWHDLTADQQATYRRHLSQKRQKMFTSRPRAMNVALLHQHIFRNGGMRRGLLPSMRGYDNVSK